MNVKNETYDIITARLYNNSINNNPYNIWVTGTTNLYLQNNITASGSGNQVTLSSVTNIYGGYNEFYGTLSGYTRTTGDLNSDPKYTSSTNLTLQADSPCRASGTNLTGGGIFTTDINGAIRPASGAWTMGAYEYGAGYSKCDIDMDGSVDSDDVDLLADVILGTQSSTQGDINSDSAKNILDLMILIDVVYQGATCP